jgi:hypothetical protein
MNDIHDHHHHHHNDNVVSSVVVTATLHTGTICDIEQPSFVSKQHILFWEIVVDRQHQLVTTTENADMGRNENRTTSIRIEFSTKLHLRYPHPHPGTGTHTEWIDLPEPMTFAIVDIDDDHHHHYTAYYNDNANDNLNDEKVSHQPRRDYPSSSSSSSSSTSWSLLLTDKVEIATAKESDHDAVMAITIVSCLLGVVLMLRDISRVSVWDNV